MNLLKAWHQSTIDAAVYHLDGLQITVICTPRETLTVIIGSGDPKQMAPEDFARLCRILGVDPEKGWEPCQSYMIAI